MYVLRYECLVARTCSSLSPREQQHRFPGGRPSISLPMPSAHHRLAVETPPPRYSLVNGSLPSYSCAMLRTVRLRRSRL